MWYREAYKIGNVCEGTVQCTYANIYDTDEKLLFSIQRKNARHHVHYTDLKTGAADDVYTSNKSDVEDYRKFDRNFFYEADYTTDGVFFENWNEDYNGFHAQVIGDVPLVAINTISKDRLVPAYLLPEALGLMRKSILHVDDQNFEDLANETFAKWLKNPVIYNIVLHRRGEKDQDVTKVLARYFYEENAKNDPNLVDIDDPDIYVSIEPGNGLYYEASQNIWKPLNLKGQHIKLLQMKPGQKVLIKPAAFNWMPTDIKNLMIEIDGKTVNLSDEIEKTEKKIEALKAAKLAAMAGTIIL